MFPGRLLVALVYVVVYVVAIAQYLGTVQHRVSTAA